MAYFFNHGTVIEGAYKGSYVYGIYDNQLQLFGSSNVNSWKYNSGQVKPVAEIDSTTVESIELLQEGEKGVDAADVGGAALLLGPIMGAAMYADGKKKLFYVNVQFKNGSKSLLKIEYELFDIVQRISFDLPKEGPSIKKERRTSVVEKEPIAAHKMKEAAPAPSLNININPNNIEPTIIRIELFLEDKEWDKAKAYAEAGLDYFPTDHRLYLYLLFADLKVSDYDELKQCSKSFSNNPNYKKAIRFADDKTAERLKGYSAEGSSNDLTNENIADDPNYEYFEHEGYSFFFPKVLAEMPMVVDESLQFGFMDTYIKPSETDCTGIDSPGFVVVTEETIDTGTGNLHLLRSELQKTSQGYVEAYFRSSGEKEGLYACTQYKTTSTLDHYSLLRKGFLNTKKI